MLLYMLLSHFAHDWTITQAARYYVVPCVIYGGAQVP